MIRALRVAAMAGALLPLAGQPARADDAPAPQEPAAQVPGEAASAASAPSAPKWKWEGAIGPIVSVSPRYAGDSSRKTSVVPGFYLRYGRLSISNASGFITRRNSDDIFRGLGLDLKQNDRLRLNVALRVDNGRRSSDSTALHGIDDVRRTIRARTSVTYNLDHGWKVGAGWGADLLGRGGGNVFDAGVSHDRRVSEYTTWTLSTGVGLADGKYMRSYYGVSPVESTASGYPVYEPGTGITSVSLGTGWRTEINPQWVALWGGSVGRLLGPAARSPLTTSARQWSLNAGIAWRF
ncbi:MipA/OmpV family protein [Piscinibacter terrae]|nr:MipA/OmpV family protein [Albitalea terrae]